MKHPLLVGVLLMAGLLQSGCVADQRATSPGESILQLPVLPAALPSPPVHQPSAPLPPTPKPIPVTIICSDDTKPYKNVAARLKTQIGRHTRILFLDTPNLLQTLSQPDYSKGPIIALGREAARVVSSLAAEQTVIFALVFTYREERLPEQGLIGVSMLPPPRPVLSLLRELQPGTIRLALPIGPEMDDYLQLVRKAAQETGVELRTATVGSDKELLHFTTQLGPEINAFWLLPDNRILSRDVMLQILTDNAKRGRINIVFSPELFPFGGLISAQYSAEGIADTARSIVKKSPGEQIQLRGTILQPQTVILGINTDLAKTLGSRIPVSLQP